MERKPTCDQVAYSSAAGTIAPTNSRERLALAVAALENIRLDLLRLDAGMGTPDDLTADLEKARAISDAVDAEVYGKAEVKRILGKPV